MAETTTDYVVVSFHTLEPSFGNMSTDLTRDEAREIAGRISGVAYERTIHCEGGTWELTPLIEQQAAE